MSKKNSEKNNKCIKHGDFTKLAGAYAKYRPGYSPMVLDCFLGLAGKAAGELQGVDAGAGTGIWSRALAQRGIQVVSVEPNDAMREQGVLQNGNLQIEWHSGCAENTGLKASMYDFVCMASSFHWPDFNSAVAEFNRILKPHGLFMALWNTRHYESNPLLVRIEDKLRELVPDMRRVSSGRSEFCNNLTERLLSTDVFCDVIYVEGRHTELQSKERYLGLWESVNDVRVQAGEDRFAKFMDYIREQINGLTCIEAEYTTRAWIARRK